MEPNTEKVREAVGAMGLDWEDVKNGLKRLLPFAEALAQVTTNVYDDMVVRFIKNLVND